MLLHTLPVRSRALAGDKVAEEEEGEGEGGAGGGEGGRLNSRDPFPLTKQPRIGSKWY